MTGLLIVNKPLDLTSMDVIRRVRKLTGIKKVGHAGTLDPLATGVLLVCISREATRHIDKLMGQPKEYLTTIDLTAFSSTDDAEGEKTPVEVLAPPTESEVKAALQKFIGITQQIPPKYSAILINGKRAYKMARQEQEFELEPRSITISSIELIDYAWPLLTIKVNCGKGTYIRSLGRDIGIQLNTGGYVAKLERTASGPYTIDQAYDLEKLETIEPEMLKSVE